MKKKNDIDGLTNQQRKTLLKERENYHKKMLKLARAHEREEHIAPDNCYISLRNINKIYPNHVQAVYDFNLDIKEHEFIVFVGPSGCGKSTTLRMIAGLEEITYGDLFIDGMYANDLEPKDRQVGMVFQSYALYPHMSVYENMAFALRVNHVSNAEIDEKIKDAASILQLEDYLQRKPAQLSGGQCQRVALGRAIVTDAKVFLMDEPLSNLDAKLRVAMRSEIVKLHDRLNATTIYVTHDQTEAMTMADRIVVMSQGYVQQIGTPKEIYAHPNNLFVATFVGSPSMNIFDATLNKNNINVESLYSLSLDKSVEELTNNFYKKEIESTNSKIQEWKDTYYSRFISDKRFINCFAKNGYLDLKKFHKYLLNWNIEYEVESVIIEQFNDRYESDIKDALYNVNKESNPLLKELVDTLAGLNAANESETREVLFGIRPEHIELSNSNKETLSLEVSLAELLGNEYIVHFDFANKDLVAKFDSKHSYLKGDKVSFSFDKTCLHIFDKVTKKAII